MAHPYIPLGDIDPNHSDQNPIHSVSSNNHNHNHTHNHDVEPTNVNDVRFFTLQKHTLVLVCKTFVRCFVTAIFIAFVLATFKIYQTKGNFTSHQKTNFNVIVTALSLCLGLNFFVSHKTHVQGIQGDSSLILRNAGFI